MTEQFARSSNSETVCRVADASRAGMTRTRVSSAIDALLSDVVRGDVMRAVMALTLAQFGAQALEFPQGRADHRFDAVVREPPGGR